MEVSGDVQRYAEECGAVWEVCGGVRLCAEVC